MKMFMQISGALTAAAVFVAIGVSWNAAAGERKDTRELVDDTAANVKNLSEIVEGLVYRHKIEEAIKEDRKARKLKEEEGENDETD